MEQLSGCTRYRSAADVMEWRRAGEPTMHPSWAHRVAAAATGRHCRSGCSKGGPLARLGASVEYAAEGTRVMQGDVCRGVSASSCKRRRVAEGRRNPA